MPIQVKMAVQYMRRVIQKKAKFDIMRLDCVQVSLNFSIRVMRLLISVLTFEFFFL